LAAADAGLSSPLIERLNRDGGGAGGLTADTVACELDDCVVLATHGVGRTSLAGRILLPRTTSLSPTYSTAFVDGKGLKMGFQTAKIPRNLPPVLLSVRLKA